MVQTEEALRTLYATPSWTQMLALPNFQQARAERFQQLPKQLYLTERKQ
jgi:hypothetical protein